MACDLGLYSFFFDPHLAGSSRALPEITLYNISQQPLRLLAGAQIT